MARLVLSLLGPFESSLDEQLITGFESVKVRALLALLASESSHPHRRETLAALLWPDWPPQSAMSNLRYALADLRKNIADREANPPYLLINRESIQLNRESNLWIDVKEFESATQESSTTDLQSAIHLYRGSFLEGFSLPDSAPFEEWLLAKREYLSQQILKSLGWLAEACIDQGDYDQAERYASRQIEMEPRREKAYQQLMRALSLRGERVQALALFENLRRALQRELKVEPSEETIQLYGQIRDGKVEVDKATATAVKTPILPSGTVTFLFTDIEGSTKLAQQYPDAMPALLARHHKILNQAIQAQNGYVFQNDGDSLAVSFHSAIDALNAALSAQRLLQNEAWSPAPIKVRMGIHTGTAQLNDASAPTVYTGYATIALTQRIMSVGHGGQILLSSATRELVRDALPTDAELQDMGEKRLKDLLRPEHLYQLKVPGLPSTFPPLKTLDLFPNNLPTQLTTFIGRENEIAEVKKELADHCLVTLTGSGGAGKSRLSLQVAADLLDQFPNGIWFVELAPLTDPNLIAQTILTAVEIKTRRDKSALESLIDFFRAKTSLLVLDNCEHLLDACARLADTLLSAAPHAKILASSREAFGIRGEQSWHVPSLSAPDMKHLPPVEQLSQYEAVRLFTDRALLVQPHFVITPENASAVAQICYRLDGIPLAIELAAARLRMLSAQQISSRLDDRFHLLTGGSRTALPRHQTLRALIDWSYDLLSENERVLLRRLAVFVGGWTLEAVEAVCAAGQGNPQVSSAEIFDLMATLVHKSLVVVEQEGNQEARYRLLETVRQYAREKLSESGEMDPIRDGHLAYFLALAERAEPELQGANQLIWFDGLEVEIDNLRAALEWSLESGEKGAELGLRMASSLWWFWILLRETKWLERTLNESRASSDPVIRAKALTRLGWVRHFDETLLDEGLALGRRLGAAGRESVAFALLVKGISAIHQADYALGKSLTEESLKLFRELGHRWGICETLGWLGMALIWLGDLQQAKAVLEESLALARQAQDANEIAFALWQLGGAARSQGDYVQAMNFLAESLTLFKGIKLIHGVALVTLLLYELGKTALEQGDYQQAVSHYKEALIVDWESGDEDNIAMGLEQLANAAVTNQQSEHAACLLGAAEALRQASNAVLLPIQIQMLDNAQSLESLRHQLDEATLNARWEEGRAMTAKQAVEYALGRNL
ncbi:MAG TPA: BTAD domain-containing putative transcriptional regulator [Anaerolineales bacterium]|nr:BTAD domain-containing putative transcriptional regulator [Anaerolineales bacterium]